MNILYDHQTFSLQEYGGISRYFSELIQGINTSTNHSAYLSSRYTNNEYAHDLHLSNRYFFPGSKFPKKLSVLYRLNKAFSINDLTKRSYDLVHATYYDPYFLTHLKGKPFVITFFDMIHERFGSEFKELAYDGLITKQKKILADRAERIIAISESTKRDIVELLNIDPFKIDVIYLGSSLSNKKIEPFPTNQESPYLLFVGNRTMYKNFKGLLSAIHILLKRYNIKIVCAGGGPFNKEERILIDSYHTRNLIEYRPINDESLPLLYQKAIAFIFPSLYEGFGIPVLEAFACNCPCIISNTSSLPEIAGDAALYIDPNKPESMCAAVELLLSDSALRSNLISKGHERLTNFSWNRTVRETMDLYECISK